MSIGELIGLGAGIVIPLGILIVGGFWGMNNRIGRVERCVGENKTQENERDKACKERHGIIDRRLERIDNWKDERVG